MAIFAGRTCHLLHGAFRSANHRRFIYQAQRGKRDGPASRAVNGPVQAASGSLSSTATVSGMSPGAASSQSTST
jgi:hypothetical protein